MAILSQTELMDRIHTLVGDDTSDETLTMLQDFNDTFASFGSAPDEAEHLRQELKDLDESWRIKYRDAFFNGPKDSDADDDPLDPEPKKTFESLFSMKE